MSWKSKQTVAYFVRQLVCGWGHRRLVLSWNVSSNSLTFLVHLLSSSTACCDKLSFSSTSLAHSCSTSCSIFIFWKNLSAGPDTSCSCGTRYSDTFSSSCVTLSTKPDRCSLGFGMLRTHTTNTNKYNSDTS